MTKALGGRIPIKSDISRKLQKDVQSIVVEDVEFNLFPESYTLKIDMYLNLKEIIIHDSNFSMCSSFVLSNLPLLETLIVGDNSFNLYADLDKEVGVSITNCPSLAAITIGESFHKYTSFYVSGEPYSCCLNIDCNHLQTVTLASKHIGSFCHAKEFSLKSHSFWHSWLTDLPSLEHISIGPNSFVNVKTVVFESGLCCLCWWIDLASLKSIELGTKVFYGGSVQPSLEYYPFKFDSSLRMKSNEWHEDDNQICLFSKK